MKKITLLCFALVSFTCAFAQQKSTVIKINPLSLALTNLNLSVEKAISEKTSFQMHGSYLLGYSDSDSRFSGYALTPEFRFYVTDHGVPQGFFVAPFGRFENFTFVNKSSLGPSEGKVSLNRFGAGVDIGYQFFFGEKVTWDIFLGPKYLANTMKYSDGSNEDNTKIGGNFVNNFGLRFGTTIGLAF